MKNTDKALEVLKTMVSISSVNMELFEYGLLDGVNEAIAELEEAMKPKTCEGCKTCEHYSSGKQWKKCGWDWECKRKYKDRYEPKDNA
jgi:hypothetical protein